MISLFCGFIFISFSQYWACTLNLKTHVFLQLCQFPHFFFQTAFFWYSFSFFGHVLESLSLPSLFLNCSFVYNLYVHLCVHVYTHTWASHSLVYSITIQSLSHVWLFVTPGLQHMHESSLSITNSRSLLKLKSIESVMPSNHLILCRPLLLLPSIFPSIRIFSNESVLRIRWPKYCGFSFSISSSNEYSGLTSFRMDWLDL